MTQTLQKTSLYLILVTIFFGFSCKKSNQETVTAPFNLSAIIGITQANTEAFIHLTWQSNSNNVKGFKIERREGNGPFLVLTAMTSNTTRGLRDQSLRTNTYYTYRITAYSTTGSSAASQELTVLTTLAPYVNTGSVFNISSTYASIYGTVDADGASPITARGVCWSTSPGPTVALSSKTVDGTGIGQFLANISSLVPSTTYYVRAYATNSIGTSYGNQTTFKTLAPPKVFVTGTGSDGVARIWVDGQVTRLSDKVVTGTFVSGISVSGDDWYVLGEGESGPNNVSVLWKNGARIPIGLSNPWCLFVSNSDVYAGGSNFFNGGYVPSISKNGTSYPISNNTGVVKCIYVSGSDVYAAGFIQNTITIWKNNIPIYTTPQSGEILSLFVNGNDVYATGYISVNQIRKAVVWKNGIMTTVYDDAIAKSVYVSNNDIYVLIESNSKAVLWKNGVINQLNFYYPGNLSVSASDVYIAGSYNKNAAIWKNGTITELTTSGGKAVSIFVKP